MASSSTGPQQGTWLGRCLALEGGQEECKGVGLPKLATFAHLICSPLGQTQFFPVTVGAVPQPDPKSTGPHCGTGAALSLQGQPSSPSCLPPSLPAAFLSPRAPSLGRWARRPCPATLCWGRGIHIAAEHSRPDTSPEMTQRPDVFEDFKQEGPGVLEGQGCPGERPGELGSSGRPRTKGLLGSESPICPSSQGQDSL